MVASGRRVGISCTTVRLKKGPIRRVVAIQYQKKLSGRGGRKFRRAIFEEWQWGLGKLDFGRRRSRRQARGKGKDTTYKDSIKKE